MSSWRAAGARALGLLGGILGLGLAVPPVAAQQAGQVRHAESEAPVTAAVVRCHGEDRSGRQGESRRALASAAALTDAAGRFRLPGDCRGRVAVAAIGFAPDTVAVPDSAALVIRLRPAPLALDPLVVAATAGAPGMVERLGPALDLALRPRRSSQELLELVPGLAIAQHAGGGKAEQIFLRGFDADHGTDVAVSVDDVPINLVSHAHGQGYTDLHFLIPELVADLELSRGGHSPRDGNLATAGAVRFTTADRVETGFARVRAGSFRSRDALAVVPVVGGGSGRVSAYVAGQRLETDGPFELPQGHRRTNVFGRLVTPLGGGARLRLTLSGYDAAWSASGQVPERAVRAGRIGRFGAIDPTEGGTTRRLDAWLQAESRGDGGARWRATAFATRYDLDLFSNFTFFLEDPERGDGIEQVDRRWVVGGSVVLHGAPSAGGRSEGWEAGASVRMDAAELLLAGQTGRVRTTQRVAAGVREANAAVWLGQRLRPVDRLSLDLGVRADAFQFRVRDRLALESGGTRRAARVSPKVTGRLELGVGLALVARGSRGFHSSDARRAVARDGNDLAVLPASRTLEVGLHRAAAGLAASMVAWHTTLESELVYVGDEGITEPVGPTVRRGVDLSARAPLTRWLWVDADLSLSRGRLRDAAPGEDRVPLAPSRIAALGLTVTDAGPLSAALRLRHVGSRPADERGEVMARGHLLTGMAARYRWGRVELSAAVENLFDVAWNEAQFATTSRLRGEAAPVTELHFTPGAPRRLELAVRVDW